MIRLNSGSKIGVLLFCIFILAISIVSAQTNYVQGLYMSPEEILSKSPSQYNPVVAEARDSSYLQQGGSEYNLKSTDQSLSFNDIGYSVHAYSDGQTLYINARKFTSIAYYAKVESEGKYLCFRTGILMIDAKSWPAMGSLDGRTARLPHVFNTETGSTRQVSERILTIWLKKHPDIYDAYIAEEDRKSADTIMKYLIEYNKRITKAASQE